MVSLAMPSSPTLSRAPTKAFIGSGGAIVKRLISLTEMSLTLVWTQKFVNIRHHVGPG